MLAAAAEATVSALVLTAATEAVIHSGRSRSSYYLYSNSRSGTPLVVAQAVTAAAQLHRQGEREQGVGGEGEGWRRVEADEHKGADEKKETNNSTKNNTDLPQLMKQH